MAREDRLSESRAYRDVDVSGQAWGSDVVADLLKAYGFEYVFFNPGASFRGLEESIVNYNDNDPRVIQAPHEGVAVSMAHGYAKAAGRPGLCLLHDVVGTLHGGMSLYNAYCDRVPVLALSGTGPLRKSRRRPWIDWIHTALDQGALVRSVVKWDDQPFHTDGVVDSVVRAHRIADTPPKGPTYVTVDHDLQENELEAPVAMPDLAQFDPPSRMAPDPEAIDQAADLLADAAFPVALVDQVGDSASAVESLVELADLLGMAVVDQHANRYNFPNTHPAYLPGESVIEQADVVLAVDVWAPDHTLKRTDSALYQSQEAVDGDFDLIDVGTHDLEASSLTADYYGLRATTVPVLADSELALDALLEAVEDRLESPRTDRLADLQALHDEYRGAARAEANARWDDEPIALPRLAAELWELLEGEDWTVVAGNLKGWIQRLWEIDQYDQYTGGHSGGAGVGYGIGAAIGGALAYADTDRVPINLQDDGDLMFYPGSLWVLSHYQIPLLTVVYNNRALYNSTEHRMILAQHRDRDDSYERALIGTGYQDPTPDYAALAESMGVDGHGPITAPEDLAPALSAALETVQGGEPALVDVVCQPKSYREA